MHQTQNQQSHLKKNLDGLGRFFVLLQDFNSGNELHFYDKISTILKLSALIRCEIEAIFSLISLEHSKFYAMNTCSWHSTSLQIKRKMHMQHVYYQRNCVYSTRWRKCSSFFPFRSYFLNQIDDNVSFSPEYFFCCCGELEKFRKMYGSYFLLSIY